MRKGFFVASMLFAAFSTNCSPQEVITDDTQQGECFSQDECRFRPRQLVAPAALIMVGSLGVSNGWLCEIKENVRDEFEHLRGRNRFRADDYLQYFPLATGVGLGFTGIKARHPLRERICVSATASAVLALTVNATKYSVGEKRPDTATRNSYPSGHTATAFMGAEIVRMEYGNMYGACAYVFSSCIAFMRLYNDRHWLNDVIAGAGVGILATRIAYWLLPYEQRLFGWDKRGRDAAIIPAFTPMDGGSVSISFSTCF